MKKKQFYNLCSFLTDLLIFALAFYAIWTAVHERGGKPDYSTFRYFTTDSNALAGAVSFLAAAFTFPVLIGKRERVPKSVLILKYVGTCAVGLTFFVVLLFLGMIFGHETQYDGTSLYMHGIIPMLAMVSWIAFDRGAHLRYRTFLFGLIPVALVEDYFPDTKVYRLIIPSNVVRNTVFYVNKCGYRIVKVVGFDRETNMADYVFEKRIRRKSK